MVSLLYKLHRHCGHNLTPNVPDKE